MGGPVVHFEVMANNDEKLRSLSSKAEGDEKERCSRIPLAGRHHRRPRPRRQVPTPRLDLRDWNDDIEKWQTDPLYASGALLLG